MYALYFACLIMSVVTFAGASIIIAALCYGMCKSLHMEGKEEAAITMMVGMLGASTVRMFPQGKARNYKLLLPGQLPEESTKQAIIEKVSANR